MNELRSLGPARFVTSSLDDRKATSELRNQLSSFLSRVIEEKLLEEILKGASEISLEGLPVTDEDLKLLLSYYPSLVSCDLSECTRLTDEGLKSIPPSIENLYLRGLPLLKGDFLKHIATWPSLKTLDLSQTEIDFVRLHKLKQLEHLKVVYLWQCRKLVDKNLEWLTEKQLDHLDISYCTSLTDACARALLGVRKIDLDGCNYITDKAMEILSSSCLLEAISLERCQFITPDGIKLFKADVKVSYGLQINDPHSERGSSSTASAKL